MGYRGELREDAVWAGPVEVEGDVVVPAGKTLTLMPGARPVFSSRPRWSCSVFRSAPEGYPIEASQRSLCDIVVLGRLRVLGTEAEPAVLGGSAWGGIFFLGGARGELRSASLSDAKECLIEAFDDSRVRLERARLSRAKVGALAWGRAAIDCRDGALEDVETGFLCREGSALSVEGSSFARTRQGVWGQHWALMRLRRCAFSGCADFGAGAYDRSRLEADECSFAASDQGVLAASRATASVRRSAFRGNRVGISGIENGLLRVSECSVEDSREQGAKFSQNSTAWVRKSRFAGNRLAGVFSEENARVAVA